MKNDPFAALADLKFKLFQAPTSCTPGETIHDIMERHSPSGPIDEDTEVYKELLEHFYETTVYLIMGVIERIEMTFGDFDYGYYDDEARDSALDLIELAEEVFSETRDEAEEIFKDALHGKSISTEYPFNSDIEDGYDNSLNHIYKKIAISLKSRGAPKELCTRIEKGNTL